MAGLIYSIDKGNNGESIMDARMIDGYHDEKKKGHDF